jgi:hypothetical protein
MTTSALIVNCALGMLAAPLLVAGSAKLLVSAERISWPYGDGLLAAPRGPRLVGGAECAAAIAVALLPTRLGCAAAAIAYGALTVAAHRLRGQRCACFGVARLAAVGRGHVAANAAAAVGAAALASSGGASEPAPRGLGLALAGAVLVFLLWHLDRRAAAPDSGPACTEPVRSVRVYVSESCPSCRSLGSLLERMEDTRRALVSTIVVREQESMPKALQGLGVPSAIGLSGAGNVVCAPVTGIGNVKSLVDRVVIGLDDLAHVR